MATPTILIVEDNEDLRRMFRTALQLEAFQVLEAGDGLTALRLLDTIPPPSLVILDVGLPVISGRVVRDELLAQVRLREVPVVVVTGLPGSHMDMQATCVLHKPVDPDRLVRTVRSCLISGS
jgi:DNA-binding response OmpR family regulator